MMQWIRIGVDKFEALEFGCADKIMRSSSCWLVGWLLVQVLAT